MSLDFDQLNADLVPPERLLIVDAVLDGLPSGDADLLETVLRNADVPHESLSRALLNQGIEASSKSIAKWRERNDVQ